MPASQTGIAPYQHVFTTTDSPQPSLPADITQRSHASFQSLRLSPINAFDVQCLPRPGPSASGAMAASPTAAQFYYPLASSHIPVTHSPSILPVSAGLSPSMSSSALLPGGLGQSFQQMVPPGPQSVGLLHPLWSSNPQVQGMPMQVSPVEQGTSIFMPQPVALPPNPSFVTGDIGPDAQGEANGAKKTRKRKKATTTNGPAKEPARGRNKRQKNTQDVATTVALPAEELQASQRSRHVDAEATVTPGQGPHTVAVCGVGPSPMGSPMPVASNEGALPTSSYSRGSKMIATDVWYFLWPVQSQEKPDSMPENEPHLMSRPDAPYVTCRLCG